MSRIAAAHPDVYIKSRAKPFGKTMQHKITLSASGPDRATVEALLDAALADLRAGLTAAGMPLHDPVDTG